MTTLQTTLPVATTVTASGALIAGKHTPANATSGALTMTLPTPTTVGARLRVEKIDASANTVTISGTIRGSGGTVVLTTQFQTAELFAESLTSWRPTAPVSSSGAVASVAGRTGVVTLASTDLTDSTATGQALVSAATAAAGRTTLGLGSAATQPSSAFDTAGAAASVLPTQTGNAGKFLTTDGTNPSWATISGGTPVGKVFSPLSYGGVGDGTTDDTVAIQAAWTALKAAGFGVLDLGAFTWLVSGLELTGGSNFVVRGSGARLLARGNSAGAATRIQRSVLVIADSSDFHVTGLTIDGQRDTIAADQWVQANLTAGNTAVTVQDGTKYVVGERMGIFGGLTANAAVDANKKDQALTVSAIAGNVLTFSPALANSYTATPGAGGTYVTRYQQGAAITVAGRQLSGEDQQVGLHLINCQRFKVTNNTSRNVWQAPIRMGTGFTNATGDGCSDGTIADNVCQHGYDQGVSVWGSQRVTVSGNVISDAGWGGIVLTQSNDCTVVGNTCTAMTYRIPGDTANGNGIAIEGGARNLIAGNTCTGNYARGLEIAHNPQQWGIVIGSPPTLTGYQVRNATSLVVSSSTVFVVGGVYSIYDGAKSEQITVTAKPDGTHLTLASPTRWNHAGGSIISLAISEDNIVTGNNFSGNTTGDGVRFRLGVRTVLSNNTIQGNGGRGVTMTLQTLGSAALSAVGNRISDNVIGQNDTSDEQVRLDSVQDVDLFGNAITGNHKFSNTAGVGIRGGADLRVAGNRISDCTLQGIIVATGILSSGQVPARVKIVGNTVERNNDIGISITAAGAGIDVADNHVVNNGGHGISLSSVTRLTVRGNTCMDNKTTGIALASATFCVVTGNICTDDSAGINPNSGLANPQTFGITESGTSDSNVIAQNSVYGNGTAQVTVIGASTVTVNNI